MSFRRDEGATHCSNQVFSMGKGAMHRSPKPMKEPISLSKPHNIRIKLLYLLNKTKCLFLKMREKTRSIKLLFDFRCFYLFCFPYFVRFFPSITGLLVFAVYFHLPVPQMIIYVLKKWQFTPFRSSIAIPLWNYN